jgi:REP element-mobilizing transposase RayT
MELPQRQRLFIQRLGGSSPAPYFFQTICCTQRGCNSLAKPEVFDLIISVAVNYLSVEKWWMQLLLAMPNHLHAIVSFSPQKPMATLVADWKRFVAKTARISWQDGFFEHRLRSNESLDAKSAYIVTPLR